MIRRLLAATLFGLSLAAHAAIPAAPDRDEGEGPYPQLILRGATVITGTGAPAYGPVDIVIEGNRIVQVAIVGSANSPSSLAVARSPLARTPGAIALGLRIFTAS